MERSVFAPREDGVPAVGLAAHGVGHSAAQRAQRNQRWPATRQLAPRSLVRARERLAHGLGMGDLQMSGVMPSGHTGTLMPKQMYFIEDARATFDGIDLGRPVHLQEDPLIAEVPLRARGVLALGGAMWKILDETEYERTRLETAPARHRVQLTDR